MPAIAMQTISAVFGIKDFYMLRPDFLSSPGNSNWNPVADFNREVK